MASLEKGLESLIEATVLGLREKRDFAGRWCEKYTEECVQRLRKYGDDGEECGFDCEYCSKYKWVINRAKHYEEKLGIAWKEILRSWEEDRSYWYLNYYQDCEQPRIDRQNVRVFNTLDDFKKSAIHNEYICPSCESITNNAYECQHCHWKVYGLFTDMGKGVFVYIKDKKKGQTIFMPKAWKN